MSNTNNDRPAVSATALVWAVAAMFIAVVAAVVAISIGVPESANPGGLIAQLLGSFATLVVALGALFKIGKVERQVNDTAEDTQRIVEQTNGQLDARIRTLSYDSVRKALIDHVDEEPDKPPF